MTSNTYYDGTNFRYINTQPATYYAQKEGVGRHVRATAVSGTAGNAITFTQAMTLDASGNLGIGTSSPGAKLGVLSADGATTSIVAGATGKLRTFGYADATRGALLDSINTAENTYLPLTINGSSLLLQTGATTRATLNASGNLGLGVTPSAWNTSAKAIQIKNYTTLFENSGGASIFSFNSYQNSGGGYTYIQPEFASQYYQASGQHQWFTAPSGTAGNAITFTQAMTLDASGNLGIGTSSPAVRLDVYKAAAQNNVAVRADAGQTAVFNAIGNGNSLGATSFDMLQDSSSIGYLFNRANAALVFGTNNTERMRLDASGNLLVGTTTQTGTFNVTYTGTAQPVSYVYASNSSFTNAVVRASMAGTSTSAQLFLGINSNTSAVFYVNGGGAIYSTSTSITAISDRRLKENIRDLDDGLNAVMALKPRKFDWKAGRGANIKNTRGFIAQEFEQVFPDMIREWLDPAPEGEEPYKAVNADLIPTLVKAIQEQQALIQSLTDRIVQLETK
jgi:hypothetical protein